MDWGSLQVEKLAERGAKSGRNAANRLRPPPNSGLTLRLLLKQIETAANTGTLVIDVENKGNGQVYAHLKTTGQESETSRTCWFPPGAGGTSGSASPGYDFQGSATNLQFGRVSSGSSGSGTVARTESVSGAIGVGEIVGTISRSFNFTTPTSTPGETHVEGYPTSSASVRLTRP